jgi:hypothetical protein
VFLLELDAIAVLAIRSGGWDSRTVNKRKRKRRCVAVIVLMTSCFPWSNNISVLPALAALICCPTGSGSKLYERPTETFYHHRIMSGLKREDEYRLKELTQLVEERGRENIDEDQLLQLLLLEDRYNKFLDEGLRKLREAASPQSPRNSFRSLFAGKGSPKMTAAPTSDSIDATTLDINAPSPLLPPVQASGKHWTWILDTLVIGAVPYASQTTDTPGHLCELNEQCYQRKSRISAVVSCLDVEEPLPAGFALAKDWETQLSVNTFFHVACIPSGEGDSGRLTADQIALDLSPSGPSKKAAAPLDDSAAVDDEIVEPDAEVMSPLPSNPAFEEIIAVCQNVSKMIEQDSSGLEKVKHDGGIKHRLSIVGGKSERRKVVFVHCKAGLARSWVFGMCFLMYHFHKTFDEADQYLRSLRSFMPKPCHVVFARSFAAYISSPKFAAHSDEEDKYIRLLAEVLSMAPKYRQKLLQDLEKLT